MESGWNWREFFLSVAAGPDKKLWFGVEHGFEDLTFSAYPHFAFPVSLNLPLTQGPTDKPTEMPTVIFPGRTSFSCFRGASLEVPTRLSTVLWFLHSQKEQWLSLGMGWDLSPTLLETLNGLERNCQELSHFPLRFSQSVANLWELSFVHHPTCQRQAKVCCPRSSLTFK